MRKKTLYDILPDGMLGYTCKTPLLCKQDLRRIFAQEQGVQEKSEEAHLKVRD